MSNIVVFYPHRNSKLFQERFGITLQKEDEMKCAVAGANFLLKTIRDEAFTFNEGRKEYIVHSDTLSGSDVLFPYLLVNIGSGVSIVRVDRSGFERVGGTNIGGGTFWGLCRLLTGMHDFDQMLACSAEGDNSKVDMLVGDIYGGRDYEKVGLSSNTIASSFGRVLTEVGSLEDYKKADITLSLLRMISYNISHIATMMAVKHGLKRIFFGGYFIRGHAYTMNTISFAVDYWSKGGLKAMFLRHEGFLGALGAFLQDVQSHALRTAPLQGAWIEKFINCSVPPRFGKWRAYSSFGASALGQTGQICKRYNCKKYGDSMASWPGPASQIGIHWRPSSINVDLLRQRENEECAFDIGCHYSVGQLDSQNGKLNRSKKHFFRKSGLQGSILELVPVMNPFPLLLGLQRYEPNIIDLHESREEREYWLDKLHHLIPGLVEKAVSSDMKFLTDQAIDAFERGEAFHAVFTAHLDRLRDEPAAYGRIGISGLFEMREECLRAFGFKDAYFGVKQHENFAALEVLPDLLLELDTMDSENRLLALVEGVLAGNIFDWGSQNCVNLYKNGTILEIYREARSSLTRPWAVDYFEEFKTELCGTSGEDTSERYDLAAEKDDKKGHVSRRFSGRRRYRKALMFCDNSGADIVLGMIPFAREMLRRGTDVCLVGNSLPAINDVTAGELRELVVLAARKCKILNEAISTEHSVPRQAAGIGKSSGTLTVCASGSGSPCLDFRRISRELCEYSTGVDLIVLEGMGRAIHTNFKADFACDTLKLAMIKNSRLAEQLFSGRIYDCVCKFEKNVSCSSI
jgi:bifunctional damage-control phosphatase, subfamily II, fusion protein